jgi:hypothetical protein
MKFEVPGFGDLSEYCWNTLHNALFYRYRFATLRRIRALLWEGDPADARSVIVGEPLPGGAADEIVLVIHESEFLPDMMMFVTTERTLMAEEDPVALALSEHFRVVEFDEG